MSSRSLLLEDLTLHPRLSIQARFVIFILYFISYLFLGYFVKTGCFFQWNQPTITIITLKKRHLHDAYEKSWWCFLRLMQYNCAECCRLHESYGRNYSQPQTDSPREWRKQVANGKCMRRGKKKKKNCCRGRYFEFTVGPQTQFHI